MPTMSLEVGGMRCRRCVREVTALLRDVPGVETVTADLVSARVRLAGTMTTGDVLLAVAGLAHPVEVLDEPDATAQARPVRADSRGTATGQPSP